MLHPEIAALLPAFQGKVSWSDIPLSSLRKSLLRNMAALDMTKIDLAAIENTTVGNEGYEIPVRVYRPSLEPNLPVLVYLHGGGWVTFNVDSHDSFCRYLAVHGQCIVVAVDYRLAPEHAYPAAVDDAYSAYMALLDKGYQAQQIVLAGDSGGCAHILNLALRLQKKGQVLPAGLVMISPFVDLSLTMPSVKRHKRLDPMVTAHALQRGADAYRGKIAANDQRVSPLFADLTGLPPLLIQVGEQEILLDDALALERKAKSAGVEVSCEVYDGMWHNFQMFNEFIDKSDFALQQIGRFVKRCA